MGVFCVLCSFQGTGEVRDHILPEGGSRRDSSPGMDPGLREQNGVWVREPMGAWSGQDQPERVEPAARCLGCTPIPGGYGGRSYYYLMCYNKPEKITKGKIQFLLPAFIIENLIYLHNKATVSRAYLEGNLLSFITPAICVLKAKADSLWGRLAIRLQSYAS